MTMPVPNDIAEALDRFARQLGLAGLSLDDTNRASIDVGEFKVTYLYEQSPFDRLSTLVDVGPAPHKEDSAGLKALLELGFFTWSQNWMTIGIDPAGARVIGRSSLLAASITSERIHAHFQQMIACADSLRSAISVGGAKATP